MKLISRQDHFYQGLHVFPRSTRPDQHRPHSHSTPLIVTENSSLFQLAFLAAFPVWSILVIALCVVVIYALTTAPPNSTGWERSPGR
jgi:hypothetical protein